MTEFLVCDNCDAEIDTVLLEYYRDEQVTLCTKCAWPERVELHSVGGQE